MGAKETIPVAIEDEMTKSYLDYAMSVIIGRALPDIRDGLKPVHRRILYAMYELKNFPRTPYKKSARVVGDVIGKYHPHGDAAVYDALVRMAQDFSMRYPLVDGQGNFGSIDGDVPAAMRYTEVRMADIAKELLADIDKDTVDFIPNYDGSLHEPTVLPSKIPNLLINGSSGIAVGMATNVPPHNLREVCRGILAIMENPDISFEELLSIIPGPDFPTRGIIVGEAGIRDAYRTGKGIIKVRGKARIEELSKGKRAIVIEEIPYQVNKSKIVERIARLAREKILEGVLDVRDESDREGIRVVVELRRDVDPDVILNQIYHFTPLETNFGINLLAISDSQPKVFNLKEMLSYFVEHRREIVTRRSQFELKKAKDRLHIVDGLLLALENIDRAIELIKASRDYKEAAASLCKELKLTEIQAKAVLDMRLQRLTSLEKEKLISEKKEMEKRISELEKILGDIKVLDGVIKDEIKAIMEEYGDERRTQIIKEQISFSIEDLIPDEKVVIAITKRGYAKRESLINFKNQKRGGRGANFIKMRENDFVKHLFVASTRDDILIFTKSGKVFPIKAYHIEETDRKRAGKPLINIVSSIGGEEIVSSVVLPPDIEDVYLLLLTRKGNFKKMPLSYFRRVRRSGMIAVPMREGDELLDVKVWDGKSEVMIATRCGKILCFDPKDLREYSRIAKGVKGIRLKDDDEVVSFGLIKGEFFVVVTERGFGKRTKVSEFRIQKRGGVGLKATSLRKGFVACVTVCDKKDELLIFTNRGRMIRIKASSIPIQRRSSSGVKLMELSDDEKICGISEVGRDG